MVLGLYVLILLMGITMQLQAFLMGSFGEKVSIAVFATIAIKNFGR